MATRPTVTVWNASTAAAGSAQLPACMTTPIRNDLVHFVHSQLAKNRRQAHAVFFKAGAEHSAESWGTGRAVARIPRISGSGTSRAGQATFGNMCRKARMFAPLKVWRKWHAKCNLTMRRHAVASALSASACTPLVMARGHRVEEVAELPLVLDGVKADKTKDLLATLNKFGAGPELMKVDKSKSMRNGQGKYRYSRYVRSKGPLVIYNDDDCENLVKAARNIMGIDVCNVNRLNILQLAPGGHLGRFLIFTSSAFKQLDNVFGDFTKASTQKSGYTLNRSIMTCADLSTIINSDGVQAVLRAEKTSVRIHDKSKKNPLTNAAAMHKLNPFAKKKVELLKAADAKRHAARKATLKAKKTNKRKIVRNKASQALQQGLTDSFAAADKMLADEEAAGNYRPGDTSSEGEE